MHVGLHDFLQFAAYYVLLKTGIHIANAWARRSAKPTIAAVTGLLA